MVQESRLPIFKERLNSLLEGRSITEFAKELGMSRQTLGFYLNGDRIPDIKAIRQICEFCGVTADWLIGLSEVKSPDTTVQAVCAFTGLSEEAVNSLHKLDGNVDGISCLLADTMRTDVLNESILNGIRNLPSTAPEVFSAEGDGGPIPIDRLDERAYEAVIRSDILDDYQEVRKRIQKAHCFLLGPDDTRIFYQERAAELVRDFIRGKRKLRIFDGAATANQEE